MLDTIIQRELPRAIATVSLGGMLSEKLEAAAAVGFDAVEIHENDLLMFGSSPADVGRIAEDLGIAIVSYAPFHHFEAMPEPYRARNFDRAERKFDVMQALGTDLLLVCSNTLPTAINDDGRAAADLHEMATRAAARGVRVCYEALAWGRHVNRWRHAWRIVQLANHPSLGLVADSFHVLAVDDDPTEIAGIPAEKLFLVQLADAPRLAVDIPTLSRHFRNFPGQGQLPVDRFMQAVLRTGYRGPLSLEIFNDEFRAVSARRTARDGIRSLISVEDRAGVLSLPAPPHLDGIEFIEFAVDNTSGRKLGEFLRALGFAHVGSHRSKSVQLFRQGRANLILNAEPGSAAADHFQRHGPSVCGLAFRVDEPWRAAARAEALECQQWQDPIGPGERRIPAVRAPDGTLINLVGDETSGRSIYDDDFILFRRESPDDTTVCIDHVTQALPQRHLDGYVLFYNSIFGLEPQPVWELADPYGLIRSRAMVSGDGSVRLSLNVCEGLATTTGRFVTASAGAGVHHVAFETDDIVSTIRRLTLLGTRIVPIPVNYYDDLATRHVLDTRRLSEFAALNILYDRDDDGEFLHAYTDTFDDRFFFEFVQRGAYCGFGAINASVRIAAQAANRETMPSSRLVML